MQGRTHHVTVEVAGRRWSGAWTLEATLDDREVCVASAYGSKRAALGRSKPEALAARLLRQIVEARHAG